MWKAVMEVYEMTVAKHPRWGWTVLGLIVFIVFNFWADGWSQVNSLDSLDSWARANAFLISIMLLIVCVGVGFCISDRKNGD